MTNFKASKKYGIYSIEVDGHATGSDSVCAGISALCYALMGVADNSDALIVESMNVYDGHFDMCWRGGIEAKTAFNMITIGLSQIAQSYPDYCRGAIN